MPEMPTIIVELVLIYVGTSLLATLFLFLRQPIILSYILLGMLIGPNGLQWIANADRVAQISQFGIILLLFLIGLNLHPTQLYTLFRKAVIITLGTCLIFALATTLITYHFGFPWVDSIIVGMALMFSSTVISLKLIPTSDLHHARIGEVMLSILLLQDILAILVIAIVGTYSTQSLPLFIPGLFLKLTVLTGVALALARYGLLWLFKQFSTIQEYIFVVSLGWCLCLAEAAHRLELSYEIGAFIAGVSLAISPIALVIAEHLKSLREFFLILFFFAVGAQFDVSITQQVLLPGMTLGLLLLALKPMIFTYAFRLSGENPAVSQELAVRLGQASEFALLISYTALANQLVSQLTAYLIQAIVVFSFIVSTYWVVWRYATPIASNARQRRD